MSSASIETGFSSPDETAAPGNEHQRLCLLASAFLRRNHFGVVLNEGFKAVTNSGERPDALGFRNTVSCLIEVKVSRADYLVDRHKKFRIDPALGVGNWRFYLCPPGIIAVEDLPPGWGLLYADKGKVIKVHGWPPNTRWHSAPFIQQNNMQAERDILYSALLRAQKAGKTPRV